MTNHPNRSPGNPGRNPTPAEIRNAREQVGLTQAQAAKLIHGTLRAWQNWEASESSPEHRKMHPGLWELFCRNAYDVFTGKVNITQLCRYPECVDNGPDGKCTDWLVGDCKGPGAKAATKPQPRSKP